MWGSRFFLNGHGVQNGCQHPHIIGRRAIHAPCGGRKPAENVPAPDDQSEFQSQRSYVRQFPADAGYRVRIETIALFSGQSLPAEFEQYPLVFELRHG